MLPGQLFRLVLPQQEERDQQSTEYSLEDEVIELVRAQLSQPGRKGYVWTHGSESRSLVALPFFTFLRYFCFVS